MQKMLGILILIFVVIFAIGDSEVSAVSPQLGVKIDAVAHGYASKITNPAIYVDGHLRTERLRQNTARGFEYIVKVYWKNQLVATVINSNIIGEVENGAWVGKINQLYQALP